MKKTLGKKKFPYLGCTPDKTKQQQEKSDVYLFASFHDLHLRTSFQKYKKIKPTATNCLETIKIPTS